MKIEDAKKLAEAKILEHAPPEYYGRWTVTIDKAKRRAGICRYRTKQIGLSKDFITLNTEERVLDTILHEIAHILTPGDGHGNRFMLACMQIGAVPRRTHDHTTTVMTPGKYSAPCPKCKVTHYKHRRPTCAYRCRKCRSPLIFKPFANAADTAQSSTRSR